MMDELGDGMFELRVESERWDDTVRIKKTYERGGEVCGTCDDGGPGNVGAAGQWRRVDGTAAWRWVERWAGKGHDWYCTLYFGSGTEHTTNGSLK